MHSWSSYRNTLYDVIPRICAALFGGWVESHAFRAYPTCFTVEGKSVYVIQQNSGKGWKRRGGDARGMGAKWGKCEKGASRVSHVCIDSLTSPQP